jgi:hypothetical protein
MSWSPWVSCLLSATCGFVACKPAPTQQVLGDSTRLEETQPLPLRSALFDGEVVRLRGARGETLGLSLQIADGKSRLVRVELPVDVATVSSFSVRSLEVKQSSSSMYGESTGPGRYPDVLEPQPAGVNTDKHAFFDVAIAKDAAPGLYTGELVVAERRLPIELSVSSASIDVHEQPLVWVFYLPSEIARVHGLADDDSPALLQKEGEYQELFRAHGAFLASDLGPERFEARRHFARGLKYWPVGLDTANDDSIARDVRRWLAIFRSSGTTPFAIPVDEPRTARARERARHVAEVIGRAGGGRPLLLRGVTDAWSPSYGDTIDVYFSPANFPEPAQQRRALGERYWTYNGRPPGAGSMILDTNGVALRTWGLIAERYDIELWYAWEGLYFSDRYNRGGPTDVLHDSVTFDERTKGGSDFGNGDGVLAYPGPLPSLRLKALRRGLQDRLLLRELRRCGGGKIADRIVEREVPRALGEVEAEGEPSWSLDESSWEEARLEVLSAIEKECHEQAALAQ